MKKRIRKTVGIISQIIGILIIVVGFSILAIWAVNNTGLSVPIYIASIVIGIVILILGTWLINRSFRTRV